jgi:hypothetical protein
MPRSLHRLVALALVFLWMPATMCCALEAAELKAPCTEGGCCQEEEGKIPDVCDVLESGKFQNSGPSVKVEPPVSTVCACLICAREIALALQPREAVAEADTARPRDWVPTWQFERRAAAPAHAPDSLSV